MEKVLVYSQHARVFRQARVTLKAEEDKVAVGHLPHAADRDTVQVDCKTAEVVGVEVRRGTRRLIRQQEARAVIAEIERLNDQLRALSDRRAAVISERSFIDDLELSSDPFGGRRGRQRSEPQLHVGAWRQILAWSLTRRAVGHAELAVIAEQQRQLRKALHKQRVKGRRYASELPELPPWRVLVKLRGSVGAHRVTLSYLVDSARWLPSYDLRYQPSRRMVEATYYAVVRQNSGEDWSRARLRFSTARPTGLLAVPQLPTWTVGRRRDFTPVPRARPEPALRPWQPAPLPVLDPVADQLRALLGIRTPAPKPRSLMSQINDVNRDIVIARSKGDHARYRRLHRRLQLLLRQARRLPASRTLKRLTLKEKDTREEVAKSEPAPEPPTDDEDDAEPPPPPSPVSPAMRPQSPTEASSTISLSSLGKAVGGVFRSKRKPTEQVPWTNVGYRPPRLHRDLPAASGYQYTLYASGRHSIAADRTSRRIPLFRRQLRVRPIHRIAPALSKRAYLIGVVKNTTGRPILRGHANLFAGTMFSGRSWLNTALPGRTLRLPLGVDDAVKVVRHLRQKTVSKGIVFKDDVTEYTVAIEIANNHGYAIEVDVRDQIPLPIGRKVEVKAFRGSKGFGKPNRNGEVQYRGKVAAGQVAKLSFSFQILRPKDWHLQQH